MSRAFASASIDGSEFPATLLGGIGRDLIAQGESVWVRRSRDWLRASTFEVSGVAPEQSAWVYRLDVAAPDRTMVSYTRRGDRVLHVRYSFDPQRPWAGIGPLQRSALGADLMAWLEQRMGEEAGGAVGHLLPIPTDGDDETVDPLKADLASLAGETMLVETTAGGWGEGRQAAPTADYRPQRIGAAWPQSTPVVYSAVQLAVLAACGVPVELVSVSQGQGQREAWRRFLHGTIAPLGRLLTDELARVEGRPVSISFESLFASDIMGRARAFQSLVGAGMDLAEAAAVSGVLNDES